ncbi:uncharacterized protein LOC126668178 [Mercurialis annua]|uniref:uncharacterized protein LOC126668178 n=1 Tax=Mercurialis annua TaxID=3986 RepID=UPI0021603951|nr:uncharacterized protein LOC126668178 [Mercurialis annua]
MTIRGNSFSFQYPQLTNTNYENCSNIMKALLGSQGVWDIVENGFEPAEDEVALNQVQRHTLKKERKKDQSALTIIHHGLDDNIFKKAAINTTSMQAWETLKNSVILGERIEDVRVVENHVVVSIEESKNTETVTIDQLCGSLCAREERMNCGKQEHFSHTLITKFFSKSRGDSSTRGGRGLLRERGRGRGYGRGQGRGEHNSFNENKNQNFHRGRGRGRSNFGVYERKK